MTAIQTLSRPPATPASVSTAAVTAGANIAGGPARQTAAAAAARPMIWTERGTSAYRRISLALFLAGFATFTLLYCVQSLLPAFAADFHVSPGQSSLALSLSTGFLAVAILTAGAVSEIFGRRGLMTASLLASAVLNVAVSLSPSWPMLLVLRALEGLALGGVPAVAMAYLAEEINPRGLGLAMGLYISGTAFGGMMGRVAVGALTELTSWRVALGSLGALDIAVALGFFVLLPPSRNFVKRRVLDPRYHLRAWTGHLRHPGLPWLFLIGFVIMGAFVTIYNYAGFRLTAAPYHLSQTALGSIFAVYLFGIAASSVAGGLADRIGRAPVMMAGLAITGLGLALTLMRPLEGIIAGIILLTIGFFMAHSVASGWVGRMAQGNKGHASSLYLLAYYLGSSLMGSLGGWLWAASGWPAVVGFTGLLLLVGVAAGLRLRRLA